MACLHACTSCGRHVRATERVCPFCDAALGADFIAACPRRVVPGRRLTRAALLFAGAAAIAACGGKEEPDGSSSSSTSAGGVTVYGPGPILDAGVVDAADAGVKDSGGVVTVYGPAPVDAGEDD